MDKDVILQAIRRCAEDKGGVPVGRGRFESLTGIRESDWLGRHWARWGDAVAEAGYAPNTLQTSYPDDVALDALADLAVTLGSFPTGAELKMHRLTDPTFPSRNVFSKYGGKAALAARLIEHCAGNPAWTAVADIAGPIARQAIAPEPDSSQVGDALPGQVYLMKSGTTYKIGRSNASGRRAYELAIQLPDKLEVVHVIDTDDAVGIERYWHERFADRRLNGEWFKLSGADVAAFKRRKRFM